MNNFVVNKNGKKLFRLDDGETHWYLGTTRNQVVVAHLMQDADNCEVSDSWVNDITIKTSIDTCKQVTIEQAKKLKIRMDEADEFGDQIITPMLELIDEDNVRFENGICLVSSTVY